MSLSDHQCMSTIVLTVHLHHNTCEYGILSVGYVVYAVCYVYGQCCVVM